MQWSQCRSDAVSRDRGGCHGTRSCARDAAEGVGVTAVQPNAGKRTELGGGGEARGGAMHDEVVLLETRQ